MKLNTVMSHFSSSDLKLAQSLANVFKLEQQYKVEKTGTETPWKNESQKRALEEFKARVGQSIKPEHDDFYLIKWLKARQFDVNKAEKMFLASMKFREKMRSDHILEEYEPPEVLKKYLAGGFVGHDKEGSPVVVDLYGRLDMRGIMSSVKQSDLEKTKLHNSENIVSEWKRQTEKLGRRVDGIVAIIDLDGIGPKSLWTPGMKMYLHLVTMLEDNYPEMLKKLFIVNAPRIFPMLFKVVKHLISDDMKEKIYVFGGDFQPTLLQFIDADQLPAFLGGTQTDQDGNPRCINKICQGGLVPTEYYLDNTDFIEHMKMKIIEQGSKLLIKQEVDIPGSILSWEFKTHKNDIIFGVVVYKNGEYQHVVPLSRVNSHAVTQDGQYTCKEAGVYYLCFDNSYSWFREKKVYYSCEVINNERKEENSSLQQENWQKSDRNFKTAELC